MSVVAAKIVLLWSIIAPIASADNLASTRTSLRTSTSPFFQVQGLCFDFTRHVCAMGQTPRCSPLVNVFLWRESSPSASKSSGPTCSLLHQVPSLEVTQRGRETVQLTKIFEGEKVLSVRGLSWRSFAPKIPQDLWFWHHKMTLLKTRSQGQVLPSQSHLFLRF